MTRLTLADTRRLRRTPGATVLLFLTDRCPVGCAHCSVASLPDGPTITDHALFEELVAGIAGLDEVVAVGISGGEPFAERRGLRTAVDALCDAGKQIAVYTSGHWASSGRVSAWVRDVLGGIDTVFLSVDGFHTPAVDEARLRTAAQAIVAAGCHLVLQVLDEPGWRPRVERLRAGLPDGVEEHLITPLQHGRGRDVFAVPPARTMHGFGPCSLAGSPTVRYDGTVLACCGESVIMGAGAGALRGRIRRRHELRTVLRGFRSSAVLRTMRTGGPRALALLPAFAGVADRRFGSVCVACWTAHEVAERSPDAARQVELLGISGVIPRSRGDAS